MWFLFFKQKTAYDVLSGFGGSEMWIRNRLYWWGGGDRTAEEYGGSGTYRWRREYGGLTVEQAKRLKELEKENLRLRRAVSDLTLDKLILKEAAEGNF